MGKVERRRVVVDRRMVIEFVPGRRKNVNADERACSHWFVPSGDKAVFCKRCERTWPFREK